ncbi:integrin alpha-6 isoform X2 [Larimichthys crocea]|uniref:integrin alpha-6 isoform X1 n=1 Tax=Larimichthys crocea TaxID=215358 RepID=UPI000F5E8DAC|nr:integrin alpha-6 isoform X1 [Larimichthys crocea]XP_027141105.1 integrin alpha-6 isoform X2 [Larimichthys crocea]
MEGRITCGLWPVVVFLLGCGRLSAFNLDTENALRKNGDPGSLFGFSLAMHRQLDPVDKRMLLVGAPRAKALRGQTSKVTGGLYNCDMSTNSNGCSRVVFDNTEDIMRESKENQWMGVTVNSQGPGGMIVTCAHRYQRRANVNRPALESRDIIGRCYVLSQDLSSSSYGGTWHFCDSRPRGHEMFGSCQQGLSATFDKDFHYVIFGAPGAYNWKGIVRLEQKNESFIDMGIFDDGPFEVGDESEKNPDLVPVPANSYLGFSLDSGKGVTHRDQLTVVAGAPRANHSGAVVLLKKGDDTSHILLEEYTLEGEGLASSFGYDLALLDLNRDGWLDIVVGAPQYFEKEGEIGGAVYVYMNKNGKWNEVKPIRIDGPQDSMFGLAVENLGDINQDSYHDFAVGAPYEGNGAGAVYIYHGSATGLSSKKAAQVLSGKAVGVTNFGYSLAGNMDLDKNSYPDLAVGSLSDSVFVYKARPVINIKKEIKITPKQIDLTNKNCGNTFCLQVEACFTYTAKPTSYTPSLTLAYSLEADADRRKNHLSSRATFSDGTEQSHEYKDTITLNSKGKEKCIRHQLKIQENIKDKLRGIPIDVSVEIDNAKRKRRQSSTSQLSPVLDANEPMTTRSEVHFLKEGCGKDNICQSNLQVKYRYMTADKDTFSPMALEKGVPLFTFSNQKTIALEVTVTNQKGDDAYEAFVIASFPPSLTYSATRSLPNQRQVNCVANKNGSVADCDIGNPFKRDTETTFFIILGTTGISLNTNEVEIDLQLDTTSDQTKTASVKAKAKVAIKLQLSVSGQAQPSQVYFSGSVKGETAIKSESEIGSAITHQFRIINLGRRLTDFSNATLNIEWPKEVEQGKVLLYLTKISSTGVDRLECTPANEINRFKKNLESGNTRTRRAADNTEEINEGTISRYSDKKNYKTLSCGHGANCVTIKCPLRGMDSNAAITLYSRLWNSTFIEDHSKLHHVEVIVKASLHVDSSTKNTVLEKSETVVKLTVFPERREARYGGVPWWIILLSILFGLLLLALLAFLLWKCGFFKRAKYEDRVPSYNAVRIKRGERAITPGNGNWENLEKKPWMTTWHDKEHYS